MNPGTESNSMICGSREPLRVSATSGIDSPAIYRGGGLPEEVCPSGVSSCRHPDVNRRELDRLVDPALPAVQLLVEREISRGVSLSLDSWAARLLTGSGARSSVPHCRRSRPLCTCLNWPLMRPAQSIRL
jgi:hypothetical protein